MNKQIRVGVVLTYLNTLISLLTGILITPITLRLFGQAEYGIYSLAISIMNMLFLFDFGFSNAIVKYVTDFKARKLEKEYQNIIAMFLILYSVIGVVAFICGMVVANNAEVLFGSSLSDGDEEKFKIMLQIVAVNLGISFPFKLFSGIIIAHERFIFYRLINIVRFIINPLITLIVLFLGYSSVGVLATITIANILLSFFDLHYCFVKLKMKLKLYYFNFSLLKDITIYSLWVFINSLSDFIYTRADLFILGAFVNVRAVAIYSVADVIHVMFKKLTMVLSGFFLPRLVRMVSNKESNHIITGFFIKVSRIQFILAAIVLIGFVFVGKEFVIIWAGKEYETAYWIVILLILSRYIPVVQTLATSILQAKDLHAFQSKAILIVALLNVAISIPLAKQYGVIGVAIGTLLGQMINVVIMNIYYQKIGMEMKWYYKEVFVLFIPMMITFGMGYLLKTILNVENLLDIIGFALCISIIYLLILFKFLNEGEKVMFLKPMKRLVLRRAG
ncbi:oligosaccharide flippase family protein [Niallia sp. Sow4_A1]|uniref:oligosaccharide flippase family protein n=1 Tax=Niallia sp. Sow4_A1 TaxID=3438793 RepID=UPI003F977ADE